MTGTVIADPIRIGVLGAARIAGLAIAGPARVTGHRLVAVAARDHRRAEDFARQHGVERALGIGSQGQATALNFVEPHQDDRIVVTTTAGTRTEELGRRSSYSYQLEAFAAHLRDGAPLPTGADDAVASMQLIDDCYRAAGLTPRPAREPLIKEIQP